MKRLTILNGEEPTWYVGSAQFDSGVRLMCDRDENETRKEQIQRIVEEDKEILDALA